MDSNGTQQHDAPPPEIAVRITVGDQDPVDLRGGAFIVCVQDRSGEWKFRSAGIAASVVALIDAKGGCACAPSNGIPPAFACLLAESVRSALVPAAIQAVFGKQAKGGPGIIAGSKALLDRLTGMGGR